MKYVIALAAMAALVGCEGGRCNMSHVEKGKWCEKCEAQATGDRCSTCNGATEDAEICVKDVVWCTECNEEHAAPCSSDASKHCCQAKKDCAEVELECAECGEELKPGQTCACNKGVDRECEKSGDWPHSTPDRD